MPVKVVAHRGWPARFPDNTLAGCLAASAVADAVELDVRRSRDGKLVLAHDPELGAHLVAETSWSSLVELDLGDGHRPALLDEVLAALPQTPILIEVKNSPFQPGYEPDHRLALEAAERSRPDDVVTSFNPATLAAVRRVFPQVRTGLAIMAGSDLGDSLQLCEDEGHSALIPSEELIVGALPGHGVEVYPFTVNDADRASELAEAGVSGIITDDPAQVAVAIRSRR